MARLRSIKPEFWTSEQVMECSPTARLMFIGLWNFCDDAGRHAFSARSIKAEIMPGDDVSSSNILGMLDELSRVGLIDVYDVDGKQYLQVTGWHHQKIDKPQKPRHPPKAATHSPNAPRMVATESSRVESNRDESKGGREQGRTPLVTPEAIALAEEIAIIAGVGKPAHWPPGWCGAPLRVQTMLAEGWQRETMLAEARATMMRKRDGPPDTINFFEKPFARAHARNAAPLPSGATYEIHRGNRQGGSAITTAIDGLIEGLEGATSEEREVRETTPRLLPGGGGERS